MDPIKVWFVLSVVLVILTATTIWFGSIILKYRVQHKVNVDLLKQNLMDDLELATSEQLRDELRKRPNCPYLMICPIENETQQGMTIEIHNVQPVPSLALLHMATAVTFKELKQRGVELPDLPGFPSFGQFGPEFGGPEFPYQDD